MPGHGMRASSDWMHTKHRQRFVFDFQSTFRGQLLCLKQFVEIGHDFRGIDVKGVGRLFGVFQQHVQDFFQLLLRGVCPQFQSWSCVTAVHGLKLNLNILRGNLLPVFFFDLFVNGTVAFGWVGRKRGPSFGFGQFPRVVRQSHFVHGGGRGGRR